MEAETWAAEAKKACKEQEWKERKERKEREKREREEREAHEEIIRKIREVRRAIAEVAREMAEPEQAQVEREREALHLMRTEEVLTESKVGAPAGTDKGGRKDDKGPGRGTPETEVDDDGDLEEGAPGSAVQKSPRRKVVTSRLNTAEVVIVRLAMKSREPEDSVSLARRPKSGD